MIRRTPHYLTQLVAMYSTLQGINRRDTKAVGTEICQACSEPPGGDLPTHTTQPIRGQKGGIGGLGGFTVRGWIVLRTIDTNNKKNLVSQR